MSNATPTTIDLRTRTVPVERVDNLAALVLVTDEQLHDRSRAHAGLAAGGARVDDLVRRVFGSDSPSVESWLAERDEQLVAA